MTKRQNESPDGRAVPGSTREEILDHAVQLFSRGGYDSTSVREIAEATGIQKASLYHHYPSKEAILVAIHDRYMEMVLERAEGRQAEESPAERIRGYIEDLMVLMRDYRPYVEVFLRERYALTGATWDRARERRDRYERYIREAVEEGMRRKIFRDDLDSDVIKYAILGACSWAYQWFEADGRLSAAEISEQFATLFLDSLMVEQARAAEPA